MLYKYEKSFKKRNALSWKNANKSLVDKDGAEGIAGTYTLHICCVRQFDLYYFVSGMKMACVCSIKIGDKSKYCGTYIIFPDTVI